MERIGLITGGAQGIGAGAARKLLQEGFSGVLLLDRNEARLAQQSAVLGGLGRVETLVADLRDETTAGLAVAACIEKFGRLDLLLNAAGNSARGGIGACTPDLYQAIFDVNVKAPLFLMQEATAAMMKQGGGTIINIASMIAYGGLPTLGIYSASKAALIALTKHAAQEFAWNGIRAFAIALGWTLTQGEQEMQASLDMPADWAEKYGAEMPGGRLILPEDIADLIAYLASPSARMMNGTTIDFEQLPHGMFRRHPALKSSA